VKSGKFKPLSAPVYRPMTLTDTEYKRGVSASAFLKSRGFSAIDGSPVETASTTRRPRLARVAKDTSKLTLNI
jgi:hypothetical protein